MTTPIVTPHRADVRSAYRHRPSVSTESEWANRLSVVSNQSRAACGLPPWSSDDLTLNTSVSRFIEDLPSVDAGPTQQPAWPRPHEQAPSVWRRVGAAFGCLGRR